MPVSAVLVLRPRTRAAVPAAPGKSLYAAVLRAAALEEPAVAARVHDADGPAALAISPLLGPGSRSNGRLVLAPDTPVWLRLSTLDDTLAEPILRALEPRGQPFVIDGVELDPLALHDQVGHPAALRLSLDELRRVAPAGDRLALHFGSPTVIRRDPEDLLFPEPAAVFGSAFRRLVRVQGAPPLACGSGESFALAVARHVGVARYTLETKVFRVSDTLPLVGFVGDITYRIDGTAPPELRRDLALLAEAAFFSGVGAKVAWGLGQCRRTTTNSPRAPRRLSRPGPHRG